jgi:uncharacterized protein
MQRCFFLAVFISLVVSPMAKAEEAKTEMLSPVPFNAIKLNDAFWMPRIETTCKTTVPSEFGHCAYRIANFRRAAKLEQGHFQGCPFDDSDVYKIMEGAAYCLAIRPDPKQEKYLNDLIAVVAKAQEPDGYLYTARTIEGKKAPDRASNVRWLNELGGVNGVDSHELYCAGHMIEAAVAHYQVTGKRTFLDVAVKCADLIDKTWGPGPNQLKIPSGHQEIELALVKLGRATGQRKYIELAEFLLKCRGHYRRPAGVRVELNDQYFANEVPLENLTKAIGHSVRTGYMLAGMTDVAATCGNQGFRKACDTVWDDTIGTKLYIHGGVGSLAHIEGFGEPYFLPNKCYSETCAAVALSLWNHRMFLLHGDAKYVDVLERALYNGALSGISLSGDHFFYQNPLETAGGYHRSAWIDCACCPTNLVRFIPSAPGMMYASRGDQIYAALYMSGVGEIPTSAGRVKLTQTTDYPWDGRVQLRVDPAKSGEFELKLRIPGWAQAKPVPTDLYRYENTAAEKPQIKVNGEIVALNVEHGFAGIRRTWAPGDTVELTLPMPVRRVVANEKVKDDVGLVALERGPIVYCVEGVDFGGKLDGLALEDDATLVPTKRANLLGGVMTLESKSGAARIATSKSGESRDTAFIAVPYYTWCNRGAGPMKVWLPRAKAAAKP